jgi:hypothetical protein
LCISSSSILASSRVLSISSLAGSVVCGNRRCGSVRWLSGGVAWTGQSTMAAPE